MKMTKVILIIITILLYTVPIWSQVNLDSGLVAYWSFDKGSGDTVYDYSGNNNSGIIFGNANWLEGVCGTGIAINGSGEFIGYGDIFNSLNLPLSISAWIYRMGSAEYGVIFSSDDQSDYWGFRLHRSSSGIEATYFDGGPCTFNNRRSAAAHGVIPYNVWVHVVATMNGPTDINIYIDGTDSTSEFSGTGGTMRHNSQSAVTGRILNCGLQKFASDIIDELRIYNRILNEGEIDSLYNQCAPSITSISGIKFNDTDNDGIFDPEEEPIPGWRILLDRIGDYPLQMQTTNENGEYAFSNLDPAIYIISEYVEPNCNQTVPTMPGYYEIDMSTPHEENNLDFGNHFEENIHDLSIALGSGRARPGFNLFYHYIPSNNGTIPQNANITIYLPQEVTYINSIGDYNSETHSVNYQYIDFDVPLFRCLALSCNPQYITTSVPLSIPTGTILEATAVIEPIAGDINPDDNIVTIYTEVMSSFDPNEMLVTPEGTISNETYLNYHIDFQNTGNDTAFNVTIIDSLDQTLDIQSIEIGAFSHTCQLEINGRELNWFFSDINLPDSIVNEPESHGFVEYSIKPLAGSPQGMVIENRASIIFDFNEPVLTNTVSNAIGEFYYYLPGDANMSAGQWPPSVIGGDVTFLVNYFRGQSTPCLLDGFYAAGDANGDCLVIGGDVTYLVNYFRGQSVLNFCPDYQAAWPTPADLPAEAPSGWPNCD